MKKFLALILALVTMLSFTTVVFAKQTDVDEFITKANDSVKLLKDQIKIEEKLEKAFDKVEEDVIKTNEKIIKMVEKEMESNNPDVDKLVEKTNDLAFKSIEKAAKEGIEVICEYEAYEIDGQVIYIDPLKVIRR